MVTVVVPPCANCGRKTSKTSIKSPPVCDSVYGLSLDVSREGVGSLAESPFVSPPHPPPRLVLHRRPFPRVGSRAPSAPAAASCTTSDAATKTTTSTTTGGDAEVQPSARKRATGTRKDQTGAGKDQIGSRNDQIGAQKDPIGVRKDLTVSRRGLVIADIEMEGETASKPKDGLVAAPLSGCGAELRGEPRVQGLDGGPAGGGGGGGGGRGSKAATVTAVRKAVARRAREY